MAALSHEMILPAVIFGLVAGGLGAFLVLFVRPYRNRRVRQLQKSTKIRFRLKDNKILFENWDVSSGNHKEFVKKLKAAFGTAARKKLYLVFVIRYEFIIDEESVFLFIDEDGSAVINLAKNSEPVRQKVVDRLRSSPDFEESV